MQNIKSENRLFDFADLRSPFFKNVQRQMLSLLKKNKNFCLHPSKKWEYPWALETANLKKRHKILDAGSSRSIFPLYLASLGYDITACDLEIPPGQGKVKYHQADICSLPFADEQFDRIFCISVIGHLPPEKFKKTLKEFRRILRKNGKLLLTTDYYEDATKDIFYTGPGQHFLVDWNFFDENKLTRRLLDLKGFKISGKLNLNVDWPVVKKQMQKFHGFPFTSLGLCLKKI
jgi:SAM-dependent methyltransferase